VTRKLSYTDTIDLYCKANIVYSYAVHMYMQGAKRPALSREQRREHMPDKRSHHSSSSNSNSNSSSTNSSATAAQNGSSSTSSNKVAKLQRSADATSTAQSTTTTSQHSTTATAGSTNTSSGTNSSTGSSTGKSRVLTAAFDPNGEYLYLGTAGGRLVVLDGTTGDVKWSYSVEGCTQVYTTNIAITCTFNINLVRTITSD
jgi:cytoskeletal protein RodZ